VKIIINFKNIVLYWLKIIIIKNISRKRVLTLKKPLSTLAKGYTLDTSRPAAMSRPVIILLTTLNILRTRCIINIIIFLQFPHWSSPVLPSSYSWQLCSSFCDVVFLPISLGSIHLTVWRSIENAPTTGHCQIHQVIFTPSRNIIYKYGYLGSNNLRYLGVVQTLYRRQPTRSYTMSILSYLYNHCYYHII